jgi:hypothetical protein
VARVPLDISNGFYESYSEQFANLRCENLYPIVPENAAYSQTALRQTDGIDLFVNGPEIGVRGATRVIDAPYFVQGNRLIRVNSDTTIDDLGPISGSDRVSMASGIVGGRALLWIVVPYGDSYYFDTATDTLTQNTDPSFLGPATSVSFINGFFVFTTDEIFFNANLDGISFTPTDFGVASIDDDKILFSLVNREQLFVIGTKTTQVYRLIGGSGFPFQLVTGATVEKGLSSRFGSSLVDNTFYFIGSGGDSLIAMYRYTGNAVQKISTPAIDHFIQQQTDETIQNAFSWTYGNEGDEFVGWTIDNRTLVYQIAASAKKGRNIWHERKSGKNRWRPNAVVEAFNRVFVGDSISNNIGVINTEGFTEFGNIVKRLFTTQPFNLDGSVQFMNSFEMAMQTGIGNSDSTDPVLNSSFSDNGVNFKQMVPRSVGGVGEYDTRVVWRRMGRIPKQRVLEFSINEPCKVVFYRIEAETGG